MKDKYKQRQYVLISIILIVSLVFLIKLFFIQVFDDKYKNIAEKIALKKINLYPNRGLIFDRNDSLLVYNEAIYDILVVPKQINNLDTSLLCKILKIDRTSFDKKLAKAKDGLHYYNSNEFVKQLTPKQYALFLENTSRFEGFYGETRTIRNYNCNVAGHILGDVGEVDSADIIKSNNYYKPRDYTGKSGLEKIYDENLRGEKGYKYVFIDKYNKEQGSFDEGNKDVLPVQGQNLSITLDIKLQAYGEELLKNKKGSIVAIEPSTGEILALVSSPGFDPNLLTGSHRGENYKMLLKNPLKPLFNRAVMAQYPPGSTFKPFTAAVALQENAIDSNFYFYCNRNYSIPGRIIRCSHNHPSAKNVQEGIQHSCNPYFWETFKRTVELEKFEYQEDGYRNWYNYSKKFGFGEKLGVDMLSEKSGNVPSPEYYNKIYGKRRWIAATIISLAIGQGEITMTPLQLANLYAIFANKGYYIKPHLVRAINNKPIDNLQKHYSGVKTEYFEVINKGLEQVVEKGTGRGSKIPGINFGGKTGTAQNPHGKDHSIFAGIAPVENPKIAIAVVVENAGGGAQYAAPIASFIAEKYLTDSIADSRKWLENRMLNANLTGIEEEDESETENTIAP